MKLAPLLLAVVLAASAGAQTEVTLAPSQDATLYESETGSLANGGGSHVFVGRTQGNGLRRGLVAFDVAASVPAGATIESAELVLTLNRSRADDVEIGAHRVTTAWTEGDDDAPGGEGGGATATEGSATWLHTSFDTSFWGSPGGDFVPTASATQTLFGTGPYVWGSTAALVADVQGWLDDPASNAGWILIGDESQPSAMRFDSRDLSNAPALRVTYSGGGTDVTDGPEGGVTRLRAVPNPFADATAIAFALAAPEAVTVEVFDALGRRVAVIADGPFAAGPHRVGFAAGDLPEGVYVVRLRAGESVRVARMVRAR